MARLAWRLLAGGVLALWPVAAAHAAEAGPAPAAKRSLQSPPAKPIGEVRLAQAPPQARAYAIPAGPLAQALNQWADASGLQLVYGAPVAQGARTAGVRGTHTPEAALRLLLGGTNLTYRFTDGATVTLVPIGAAAEGGAIVLDPITVEAGRPAPPTATIGTLPPAYAGGQVARGGRVGLLGNRDIMDTPFSTQSYTEELIRDQQARSMSDVLLNDSSVRSNISRNGFNDQFLIRGFLEDQQQFDGLAGLLGKRRFGIEGIERVEIIKGPNALLNGVGASGGIGGTINLVPKRALDEPLTRLTARYLSEGQGEGHLDVGRRFGSDGAFGVRFNSAYRDGDPPVDNQSETFGLAALALDYRGERLRATFDAGYQRFDLDASKGLLFANPGFAIPDAPEANSNYAQDWERTETRRGYALAAVEYDLLPSWTASLRYGYARYVESIVTTNPSIIDGDGTITDTPGFFPSESVYNIPEASLRGQVSTGPIEHRLVATALQIKEKGSAMTGAAALDGGPIFSNLYDPVSVPSRSTAGLPRHLPTTSRSNLTSFALADTLSILGDRVQLTLGARQQRIESRSYDVDTRERTSDYDESELTPAVGLLVKPLSNLSLYASYIEALNPGDTAPFGAENAGEVFPPTVSKQYEVGAKLDLGRIALTAAVFQITQPSGVVDPATLEFDVDGEQRNRGIEIEAFGTPVDGLRLLGGVTFLDGELRKTEGGVNDGNDAVGVPDVQLNLGGEIDIPWLEGLTLGGRAIWTSSQKYDAANTQQIPSWWRFDAGARYAFEVDGRPLALRLNVENVADSNYWQSTGRGFLSTGSPRTVLLSLSADF